MFIVHSCSQLSFYVCFIQNLYSQCVSWYSLCRQPSYSPREMQHPRFRPEVGFVGRLGSGPLAQDDPDGTFAEFCVHVGNSPCAWRLVFYVMLCDWIGIFSFHDVNIYMSDAPWGGHVLRRGRGPWLWVIGKNPGAVKSAENPRDKENLENPCKSIEIDHWKRNINRNTEKILGWTSSEHARFLVPDCQRP